MTASKVSRTAEVPTAGRAMWRKAAASGWVGGALEYYDWFIYAQAAALVFPGIFFPEGNATIAVLASLGTYAVGYVARPIGAAVLGHWGDKKGRKNVLVLAMLLMGVSTFAVALLPTYGQVGIVAPILLTLVRLVQGFAVAGELSGASAMIIEHAPHGRRGFLASFALHGTVAGQILGAAIFLPMSMLLSDEAFKSWGWRIPFVLSAVVVIAGFVIRRRVEESRTFEEQQDADGTGPRARRVPLVEAFRENWREILRAVCMTLVNVIGVTVSVFGGAYATQSGYGVGMSTSVYLWIQIAANIAGFFVVPVFGHLSDRFGRRPIMIGGGLAAGLLCYPYLWAVSSNNVPLTFVLAMLSWGVAYQAWNATFACFFQELFPAHRRVTGFALSQNVGLAIIAFLPTIFTMVAPPGSSNVPLTIGTLCLVITVIASIATWKSPETYRVPLDQLGNPDAKPLPREEYERLRTAESSPADSSPSGD
ncbi:MULTISPECIES: MFS transporter [unclassified Streptomyces]|uniref:MFS transporter n=1 Tax=unclassified Streptomyces TaxID=2593676 RepID=UPI00278C63F9|nr:MULTISPECIES: MFS transporter [unclassified Streptomyces]